MTRWPALTTQWGLGSCTHRCVTGLRTSASEMGLGNCIGTSAGGSSLQLTTSHSTNAGGKNSNTDKGGDVNGA